MTHLDLLQRQCLFRRGFARFHQDRIRIMGRECPGVGQPVWTGTYDPQGTQVLTQYEGH